MKRVFDIVASFFGLILSGWLIMILALAVRLDTPGPGLLRQPRVGRGERVFICYKLRTMVTGTVSAASHETPRAAVTRLGAFLRRWKLDELPQLWNVLRGDMSLVGPRPCLPVQAQLIEARRSHGVFAVRPGITGPAQVQGVDMSEPERLARIDGAYAARATLAGDIGLILATMIGQGRGDRVR